MAVQTVRTQSDPHLPDVFLVPMLLIGGLSVSVRFEGEGCVIAQKGVHRAHHAHTVRLSPLGSILHKNFTPCQTLQWQWKN